MVFGYTKDPESGPLVMIFALQNFAKVRWEHESSSNNVTVRGITGDSSDSVPRPVTLYLLLPHSEYRSGGHLHSGLKQTWVSEKTYI